ncbi:MAG TPA: hypothetical protein VJN18_07425 [Polyangiaceae bacterium]|nr:hypothetical protein [Polyangiaceae bacterium]
MTNNTISECFRFGKGWWDYVELLRRLGEKLDATEVRVVGHYLVETPPPEESLPMPVVALERPGALVALKWDFGAACRWPREWTMSIRRRSPYRGPIVGLFDPSFDLRRVTASGLPPSLVFGPYRDNQAEFSCEVSDEWDVAMLLRLVFHEA